MNDYLVRGMSMDGFVKVVAIRSTEMVRRGAQIQGTTPNATAAFGRALTAARGRGGPFYVSFLGGGLTFVCLCHENLLVSPESIFSKMVYFGRHRLCKAAHTMLEVILNLIIPQISQHFLN